MNRSIPPDAAGVAAGSAGSAGRDKGARAQLLVGGAATAPAWVKRQSATAHARITVAMVGGVTLGIVYAILIHFPTSEQAGKCLEDG